MTSTTMRSTLGHSKCPQTPATWTRFFLGPPMVWEQILNIKTSPSIANKGDHSMPTLQNPRHERFAQELAISRAAM